MLLRTGIFFSYSKEKDFFNVLAVRTKGLAFRLYGQSLLFLFVIRVASTIFAASKTRAMVSYCLYKKLIIMANTSDISRGMILNLEGSLYTIIEFGENKTARAAAKVWAKLKGVDNNRSIEKTWNSGDTIFPVRVERRYYQFLYKDDTGYNFMDNETFEQVALPENTIDAPQYLKEGQEVGVLINTENDQVLGAEMPDKIVLLVTYTEPGLRGDTATRTLKPATLETGASINVPLFVNEGELIRINTKTGEYVERVKE
jgi:elongation factor P